MPKKINLTNQIFGYLIVIKQASLPGRISWECKCSCGNTKIIKSAALRSGDTKSCGCLHKEQLRTRNVINKTHGDSNNRMYNIWQHMKVRCNNPQNKAYKWYGAKGIKVCNKWLNNYEAFKKWALSNGYKPTLTIDRIEGHKGYTPSNCRWATKKIQNRNKSKQVNCKSKYIGVCPGYKSWTSYITVNKINIHLGSYSTELKAAHVRDNYIHTNNLKYYKLNFKN